MRVTVEEGKITEFEPTLSSDFDSINVSKMSKSGAQVLYGGAISASVTLANATEIDMTKWHQGGLEAQVTSGSGTWVFALYSCNTSGGNYVPVLSSGTAVTVSIPATGGSVPILNMTENYYKLVPTLTGTSTITCNFTKGV